MFEVGDIVTCKAIHAETYRLTTPDSTLEVVALRRQSMVVKILTHSSRPHSVSAQHCVLRSHFTHVHIKQGVVKVSSLDYIQSDELSAEDKKLIGEALSCLR